ncbi:MAG: Trm112 family protein [Pseudomonadota bacterium]|nr:Trm112 family protein [Pseudomonadota bacterium]
MMNKAQDTDRNLLSLLVCPVSLSGLIYDRDKAELISLRSRLAFPVQDGVPIMLEAAARPLDDEDHARLAARRFSSEDN